MRTRGSWNRKNSPFRSSGTNRSFDRIWLSDHCRSLDESRAQLLLHPSSSKSTWEDLYLDQNRRYTCKDKSTGWVLCSNWKIKSTQTINLVTYHLMILVRYTVLFSRSTSMPPFRRNSLAACRSSTSTPWGEKKRTAGLDRVPLHSPKWISGFTFSRANYIYFTKPSISTNITMLAKQLKFGSKKCHLQSPINWTERLDQRVRLSSVRS